jgi:hypothetical protein
MATEPCLGDIAGPALHEGFDGSGAVGSDDDSAATRVAGNSFGNIAVAQLRKRSAFGNLSLAHVVGQNVHGRSVAGDQGLEATAGADGSELAVIADHHDLGAPCYRTLQQAEQQLVVGHGRLVAHHDAAVIERELAVLQAPGERGKGPARLDAGGSAQRSRRLSRRRGAQHPVAVGLEGLP